MGCPTPGRFDVLGTDPLKLIDACHNPQSCENFVSALDEIDPCVENRPTLLCAALADKDVAGIVDVLVPAFPRVVVTQTDSDRALPAGELAAWWVPISSRAYTRACPRPSLPSMPRASLRSSRHHHPSRRSSGAAPLTHPLISCGEIRTVLQARSLKQSVYHRNLKVVNLGRGYFDHPAPRVDLLATKWAYLLRLTGNPRPYRELRNQNRR